MATSPLTSAQIAAGLPSLPGWSLSDDALVKTFKFPSFSAAMAFMARGALDAEALDHHPEWTNVYDRVSVRLSTHDAGHKVTAKDLALAARLDRAAR